MTYSRSAEFRDLCGVLAEGTLPLNIWVGAGLSAHAGIPMWAALRRGLEDLVEEQAAELDLDGATRKRAELQAIRYEEGAWVAFERLRNILGETAYVSAIRRLLGGAAGRPVPRVYESIWRLNPRKVLTLNIDDFARRGHAKVFQGHRALVAPLGADAFKVDAYIQSQGDMVVSLHGVVENSDSWVFTYSELRSLRSRPGYKDFIRHQLVGGVNLFLGMSVDDIAVGGHLEDLRDMGVQLSQCFWFSDRNDPKTDTWAQGSGMRLIRYNANPDHSTVINEFLDDLITAVPEPEAVPLPIAPSIPVVAEVAPGMGGLPSPGEAPRLDPEMLRNLLNRRALEILEDDSVEDYENFCREYERAIYQSWYVSENPPENYIFGYKIEKEVASGAFGRVFRALAPDGSQVAIKLLRHEIRSKRELLESFRRGVRSMQILHSNRVQSMVEYKAASEIPSLVVMDWIEGPNLAEARAIGILNDWDLLLKVSGDLARVIYGAHRVPERVLHRDLRPANVMLRDYWTSPDAFEVVVLDFDLSWHDGAENRSVQFSTALGYLAPEQRGVTRSSTRRAAVDVYGLGMTLWHLLMGVDPVPDQHMHQDYLERLRGAAANFSPSPWQSLGDRFANLIYRMTQNAQDDRPDMSRVITEIDAIAAAHRGVGVIPLGLLVEEVAARSGHFAKYSANYEQDEYKAMERRGIEATIRADRASGSVVLEISWVRTGVEERTGLTKYVQRADEGVRRRLVAGGWKVRGDLQSGQSFHIVACRDDLREPALDQIVMDMDSALELIEFS